MKKEINKLNKLFESGKMEGARDYALKLKDTILDENFIKKDPLIVIKYACLLIDIGAGTWDVNLVNLGKDKIETNYDLFSKLITKGSIEYNLGNAKKTIFDILRYDDAFKYTFENIELLMEAKANYFRSSKYIESENFNPAFKNELLINLANSLDLSARISEAIIYYRYVIESNHSHYEANVNLAIALKWLNIVSNRYSIIQIAELYYYLLEARKLIPNYHNTNIVNNLILETEKAIYNNNMLPTDILSLRREHKNKLKSIKISEFEKFCLTNHLFLSEHSIYCQCEEARKDDLDFFLDKDLNSKIPNEVILVLNKVLEEYSFGRQLLFIYSNERSKINQESLRTAYRIVYGILDKLAYGLLKLQNIEIESNEPIYFESFWKKTKIWNSVNSLENFGIIALYSIACDLNVKKGELSFFKIWRNKMEHGLLLFSEDNDLKNRSNEIIYVDPEEMFEKSIKIFQIVRSAIFSFIFATRNKINN